MRTTPIPALYALDTFSATDRLTVTAGGRFNYAGINLEGSNGALLNGFSNFFHVNPTLGFTYKLTPDINFYAGYAMTNRAPTPLELGCADPDNPCIIDNFLVSDPQLKQVVGQTFEVGFRGTERSEPIGPRSRMGQAAMVGGPVPHHARQRHPAAAEPGYRLRLFRQCRNDVAPGRGGQRAMDRRQVVGLRQLHLYRRCLSDDLPRVVAEQSAWPTRTASFRITNGMPIAGIPKNTVKVGVDYAVTDKWHVGADMVAASGQVLFGNENGALPQAPGYAVFGLHTSYQVAKQVQIYGLIQNLFDQRFYTAGGLFETDDLPNSAPSLTDPTTFGPARPFAIYGGMRITL